MNRVRLNPAVLTTLVFLALTSVAACGATTHNTPAPSSPAVTPLPARPQTLQVSRAQTDPCGLLTSAQTTQLGVNRGTRDAVAGQAGDFDCVWMRYPDQPDDSWGAHADIHHGADYYLSEVAQIVQVAGYGAVQTTSGLGQADNNCQLYLDVAPGQSLEIQYSNERRDRPGINHELACQQASRVAELALANLRATTTVGVGGNAPSKAHG